MKKTLVSWSSGKDSAWMIHVLRQQPDIQLAGVLTTVNEVHQRVAMHAVRVELLQAQADALGLPLWQIPIPSPCPNEVYERVMAAAVARAVSAANSTPSHTRDRCSRNQSRSSQAKSSNETALCLPMSRFPSRIVCLTEETTETLYLLGQGDRIVGVSGYTVRPPEAREKPKISAFINARFDKIEALRPDLVLAFSALQADLAAELVRRGLTVVTFNQRSLDEIFRMIRMIGGLVGCQMEAARLAGRLETDLDHIRESAARFPSRLRVFFEE